MTRDEFLIHVGGLARKAHPHLTTKQSLKIAERIATVENQERSPLWNYDGDVLDMMAARKVQIAAETAPELFRIPPTREQFVAFEAAALEKKLQRPATATERLNITRAAEGLTPDDLLERVAPDVELPDVSAKVQFSKPAAAPVTNVDAYDAEIQRRIGKPAATLMPTQRLAWHRRLADEQKREQSAERNRELALSAASDDVSALHPRDRIVHHRRTEAAKSTR